MCPARIAIKLILDSHSAHISRETQAWLAAQPAGRFEFTFTPKHGSWLNLVEGFFSKFIVLRHIRVASKHELKERIMAGIEDVNRPGSAAASNRFGVSTRAVVVAGATDGCAAFLATGAGKPGDAVTSLGSDAGSETCE